MIRKNSIKERLRDGEGVVGVFCNIPSPAIVEILGHLGFDFFIIDAEHAPPGVETVEHMIRAADATGLTPIARVAVNLPQNILRYLDAGSLGIQIPMVNTAIEAQEVIRATKYPPLGLRGLASVRASGYGLSMPTTQYVEMANQETMVVIQIETVQAMENIADIAAVDQVDVVFIGPNDLSSSLGYTGQPTHPKVLETIERLGTEIQRAGKVAGTLARDIEAYRYWRERGFQYLATTVTGFFSEAGHMYLTGCREEEQKVRKAKPA